MPAPKALTAALRDEYETLYAHMTIRPEKRIEIAALVRRMMAQIERYKAVSNAISVPWFIIAIIHCLEASLRFDRHLHNGDPLSAPTTRVPAGRPPGHGPFTWEESAIDALTLRKLSKNSDWSLAAIAFLLESYNGFGYRNKFPHVKSPYLWSFSNVYSSGKYVADGVFLDQAVSQQAGGLVLLQALAEVDPAIRQSIVTPIQEPDSSVSALFPVLPPADGTAFGAPSLTSEAVPFPGHYLLRNVTSPSVNRLKARLKSFGCDAGSLSPTFDVPTELAVKLFQARSCLPSGDPLDIDGIVGPQTWGALFGISPATKSPAPVLPSPRAQQVIDKAASQIGVREAPLGSNSGPLVDAYLRRAGSRPGNPWCMAFAYWCFSEVLGSANPLPKTAGVHDCWQRSRRSPQGLTIITAAEAQADPSRVKPGMIFAIDTGGGHGHAGIVAAHHNGTLETIEGNTNDEGSREGNGVYRRTRRRVSQISLGFIGLE